MSASFNQNECPICMDDIIGLNNRVTTECGHAFHCSCLMQNAAHNGFGCPYCRTVMAEEPVEDDDDDQDDQDIQDELKELGVQPEEGSGLESDIPRRASSK